MAIVVKRESQSIGPDANAIDQRARREIIQRQLLEIDEVVGGERPLNWHFRFRGQQTVSDRGRDEPAFGINGSLAFQLVVGQNR